MEKKIHVLRTPITKSFLAKLKEKAKRIGIPLTEVVRRKLEDWLQEPDEHIIRRQ